MFATWRRLFRSRPQTRRAAAAPRRRSAWLTVEPLEVRAVPTITVLGDNQGPRDDQFVMMNGSGNALVILRNGSPAFVGSPAAGEDVVIDGLSGTDLLIVDYTNGNPIPGGGLMFTGESLALDNGAFTTATYTYINANDGTIDLDGSQVRFFGLTPLRNSGTVVDAVFNLPAGRDVAFLEDDSDPTNNMIQLRSGSSTFELTLFANPTGSLTVNTGGGDDAVSVTSLDSQFAAALTLNGTANGVETFDLAGVALTKTLTLAPLGGTVSLSSVAVNGAGLVVVDAGTVSIADSTFTNPNGDGVQLTAAGGLATLSNVQANNNGSHGLSVSGLAITVDNSSFNNNGSDGVALSDAPPTFSGTTISGNSGAGVRVFGLGSSGGSFAGNTITSNTGAGITLSTNDGASDVPSRIAIRNNSIFGNGGLGIDLGDDGVTPNDADDTDAGANGLQNFPVLLTARDVSGSTDIAGTIRSTPNTILNLDFYENDALDPSGFGEGQRFLGTLTVTTDATGLATFTFNTTVSPGATVTATATDPSNNTSEFGRGPRGVLRFTAASGNIGESQGPLVVTVERVFGSAGPLNVRVVTSDGTAVAPSDYTAVDTTLTFSDGQLSQTVSISIVNDATFERLMETFAIDLVSTGNGDDDARFDTPTRFDAAILDDDPQPTVNVANFTANEGNAGTTTPFTFTVTLTNPSALPITVDYATFDGTATAADNDFFPLSGTLIFLPGETVQTVAVNVVGDTKFETNETFTVNLSNIVNAQSGVLTGTGTITNDDRQPTVNIADATANEGNSGTTPFTFVVTLSNASFQTITVEYATADGSAMASDNDYTALSGTLTFAPGATQQTLVVNATGDTKFEGNETFTVALTNPVNGTLGTATGTGSITNDDPIPTINIDDVATSEGDSGPTLVTFVVSLSNPSDQPVTVNYTTTDGSATALDSDFVAASGAVTFAPGEIVQNVVVTVVGDRKFESDESFTVELSSAAGGTIGDGSGAGSILNDDQKPTVSIGNVANPEGDPGTPPTTPFAFAVTLSNPSFQTITVEYATADGSATAPSDYAALSGTLTFAPGETALIVTVAVTPDRTFEGDETFTVVLTNPTNADPGTLTGTGTIQNDDNKPIVSIGNVASPEGDPGTPPTTPFVFTVSLSNPSDQTITVDYATVDGSATAGSDYTALSGTLTFAPGETAKTVTVAVTPDRTFEGDETFTVTLTNLTNADPGTLTGTGTIQNDDPQPTVNIAGVTANEGNSGTSPFTFVVTLSNPSDQPLTIGYTTFDGSATAADSDYTALSGTLTFAPGATQQTVVVNVTGDTKFEVTEDFLVNLANPVGGTLGTASATGTIINDDPVPTISVDDFTANEGNSGSTPFTFTVRLSNPTFNTVNASYATADGSATAGVDYTAASGALSFAPGQTLLTVVVNVAGDTLFEFDETFTLNLSALTNANAGDVSALGTIVNDDPAPVVSVNNVSANEGQSGTTPFTFTVSLSVASGRPVTLNDTTADGSATTADNDYAALSGTLSFAVGETSKTVVVNVNGDQRVEPNETFALNLSNIVGAQNQTASGTGTIVNEDIGGQIQFDVGRLFVVDEGVGTITLTVSRTGGNVPVSVPFAVDPVRSTATNGSDFTLFGGTLSFAATETLKTITVAIIDDADLEDNEQFTVALGTPTNGATLGVSSAATVTITDNDNVEELYVRAVYCKLLGRVPPRTESAFWVDLLRNGATREQVAFGIGSTPERRGVVVQQFYQTFLDRQGAPSEVAGWVNAIAQGLSEADVAVSFLTSAEYTAAHATNASYVQGLFRDILEREASASEVAFIAGLLDNGGRTRAGLALEALSSEEALRAAVVQNYEDILGREPAEIDAGGLAFWVGIIERGERTPASLTAAFLASSEFGGRLAEVIAECTPTTA